MSIYSQLLKIRGRKRIVHFNEIVKSYPGYDRDSVRRMQMDKMKKLLLHASSSVEYYQEVFRILNFNVNNFNDITQIFRLPLLTKCIIRDRINSLKSSVYNSSDIFMTSTGGSTGNPFNFYKDIDGDEKEIAHMWHSWSQIGWEPRKKMAWFWGGPSELNHIKTFWGNLTWRLGGKFLFDAFDASEDNMKKWSEIILKNNIRCAIGYASTLDIFSKFLLRNNKKLRFDFVISTAEKLYDFQRKNIESAFGCKLFNQYGCRENRIIAFECKVGKMHIRGDNVYVDFVREPQEEGLKKIVITSFNNYGMPFIRYDTNDYGEPEDSECPCGNPFPVMKIHIGRVSDNFKASDGRVIHGEYFTHLMYGIEGIESFQFHQMDLDYMELLLVKNAYFSETSQRMIDDVVRKSKSILGKPVEVRVKYVDRIEAAKSGKHRFTISDVLGK